MPYDVFNGDADGLCALQQLRLHNPLDDAHLVTGPKRETSLLSKIALVEPTDIIVLDVSLRANSSDAERLLRDGHRLTYIDHHNSGPIPKHKNFINNIDINIIAQRITNYNFIVFNIIFANTHFIVIS